MDTEAARDPKVQAVQEQIRISKAMAALETHQAWQLIKEAIQRRIDSLTKKVLECKQWTPQELGRVQGEIEGLRWVQDRAKWKADQEPRLKARLRQAEKSATMPSLQAQTPEFEL